ncbi:NmrA family NAD(P)-binding protein [Paeniglutamicibacter sp. ABSL32-1]|uniref:NmrA family NAD(P)-binding protein n=1 Tax=Paeniglutamicibacter quisquiliarum TaxID=2849498 RepID=UPI001C2DB884|nr:NmrA family NAD(P)-binding protein [Paeniglutamicibacter quisquiliarum]
MENHVAKPDPASPIVLVIGTTGQVGKLIVEEFDRDLGNVRVRYAARKPERVDELRAAGRDAVRLDLDDPRTFAHALYGVDRVYLLTGYTVAMLAQSKTLVDAAVKAGVGHIVHQGVFANWDVTDPHFVWHQMIERYIEGSGLAWTHLHPNVFMDGLASEIATNDGAFSVYWDNRRVGWIAARDIAAVAATVLRQGPSRHGGKEYWLSTEVASGPEVAAILSDVLDREISCDVRGPEEFLASIAKRGLTVESWYADAGVEFNRQVIDGRMGYIGTVRDDVEFVTGRPSTSLRQWGKENLTD